MPTLDALDLDLVRAQFPMFSDPDLEGWVFAENAGGSYPCRQVVDRLTTFYTRTKTQVGYAFPVSQRAAAAMQDGPARLAPWLGVSPEAIHIGPSTSQNTYVLAQAFRESLREGDAVVVTEQDHEANSGVWRRLADTGIEVREWQVDPVSGRLDPDGLDALLDDRIRVVAFPHASNVIGEVNPVADICARIHEVRAVAIVDGVAMAPHGLPDVPATGADVYLFSTYKTYGPHQGVMVVHPGLVERLPNQGHFFNAEHLGKRLVPAGPDHAQVAAVAGIADYLDVVADHHLGPGGTPDDRAAGVRALWRAHETELLRPLLDFLTSRGDLRVLGPTVAEPRVPTVAVVGPRPAAGLAEELVAHRVMASGSHFYAYRLVEALGLDPAAGVLRLSFVHTTTPAEIQQTIGALEQVLDAT